MTNDVFGEVAKKIDGQPETDERLSKINNILKNLKGEETQEPTVGADVEVKKEEQTLIQSDKTIDNNGVNTYNPDSGEDYKSKYEDALDLIQELESDLQEKDTLESELAKANMRIRMLESELETLSGTTKKYMEQVHSVEYDASRMQVPTDFMSAIRYFKDSQGDDDYAKEAKKLLQSELIRLVEKMTGKPLTSYITDLRAFGAEPMGQGGISTMTVQPQRQQTVNKGELLGNIF